MLGGHKKKFFCIFLGFEGRRFRNLPLFFDMITNFQMGFNYKIQFLNAQFI